MNVTTPGAPNSQAQVKTQRADRYNVPDDMTLVCRWCPQQYPAAVTAAVAAAHATGTHDGVDPAGSLIELVPLCVRCTGPMRFVRVDGTRKVFDCDGCRRTRRVSRRAWDAL